MILKDQFCKLIVYSIKIRFRYIKRSRQLTDKLKIGCMDFLFIRTDTRACGFFIQPCEYTQFRLRQISPDS